MAVLQIILHHIDHRCLIPIGWVRRLGQLLCDLLGPLKGNALIVAGDHEDLEIHEILSATLQDVVEADDVPAANEIQCGWGVHHSLTGAQRAARTMLNARNEWRKVTS